MIRTIDKEKHIVMVTGTAALYCGKWQRLRARKLHTCRLSGKVIMPGDLCYAPLAFGAPHLEKVAADVMEKHAEIDDALGLRKR